MVHVLAEKELRFDESRQSRKVKLKEAPLKEAPPKISGNFHEDGEHFP